MAKKTVIEETYTERIVDKTLEKAVHEFMMPYAESIILDRALPRVEDGLKPVQRRILFTMHELNLKPDGPYKKSARVVGDCLGKYHPHGDSSIYQAMVNLAQDFNMRNPLVNGQGNFGSIDGDGAAAMRYTEVKMEPLACEMLKDIDKDTIKWVKNFDDSQDEPDVLPAAFPNLLVNGTTGIAIGLATKIPPHNLTEVIDGTVALIDDPKMSIKDLLQIIKGPDFPTGAFICEGDSFEDIYTTGKGKIMMRAKVGIETEGNKQNIVITELPYNVNKSLLQLRIKDLRDELAQKDKNNVLSGIQAIVDESDRNGIRVVIRLKKGEDPRTVLDYLYQKTDLQCNFNVNIVAIADGRPQQLGLIPLLNYYIAHRRDVVYKRSQFDLNVAKKRENILDGFAIILPDIDGVVAIIKGSNSRSDAKEKLKDKYAINDKQADAILDLRLVNLTKLEVGKIEKELAEIKKTIARLSAIVGSKKEQLNVVREELLDIRNRYRTKRLTTVLPSFDALEYKPEEAGKGTHKRGYLVRSLAGSLKFVSSLQYLGSDRSDPKTAEEVISEQVLVENGNQPYAFGSDGNCYRLDVDNMKESRLTEEGILPSALASDTDKKATFVKVITFAPEDEEKELYFFTKQGMVKKSLVKECIVNKDYYQVMVLKDGDEVINVEIRKPNTDILFVTDDGMALNVSHDEFGVTGRKTGGVIGMTLSGEANVVYASQAECDDMGLIEGEIGLVSSGGFAKRIIAPDIDPSKRARKGLKVMELGAKGKIIYVEVLTSEERNIALMDKTGYISVGSTEEFLLDRTRIGKGKPFPTAAGACVASNHFSEID